MFNYHAWLIIDEAYREEDESDALFRQAVDRVRKAIETARFSNGLMDFRFVNGMAHVAINGFHNHESGTTKELVGFLHFVAGEAPGSYGLLYIQDDEDENGFENAFQVYVLAKGKVTRRDDPFLSPCNPTIEE